MNSIEEKSTATEVTTYKQEISCYSTVRTVLVDHQEMKGKVDHLVRVETFLGKISISANSTKLSKGPVNSILVQQEQNSTCPALCMCTVRRMIE